jgi:hypothetical protein
MHRPPVWAFAPLAAVCLSACPPTPGGNPLAFIHYKVLGVCQQAGSARPLPQTAAIVLVEIENIDNSAVPTQWVFDPSAIAIDPPSSCQYNLTTMSTTTIEPNQTVGANRKVGIAVQGTPNAASVAQFQPILLYGTHYGLNNDSQCASSLGMTLNPPNPIPTCDNNPNDNNCGSRSATAHPGTLSSLDDPQTLGTQQNPYPYTTRCSDLGGG